MGNAGGPGLAGSGPAGSDWRLGIDPGVGHLGWRGSPLPGWASGLTRASETNHARDKKNTKTEPNPIKEAYDHSRNNKNNTNKKKKKKKNPKKKKKKKKKKK